MGAVVNPRPQFTASRRILSLAATFARVCSTATAGRYQGRFSHMILSFIRNRPGRSLVAAALAVSTVGLFPCVAPAEGPSILGWLRPEKGSGGTDLELKVEHGPWLIYVAALEGSESKMQAVKLAAELREKHGLKSYVMPKRFDLTGRVIGSGLTPEGRPKTMRYQEESITECYSVVVGDYDSVESPAIRDALAKIKALRPTSLQSDPNADGQITTGEKVRSYREQIAKEEEEAAEADVRGPLSLAFITRNPLLPAEFFDSPTADEFITDLNKRADYSLFENKSRFTVRVANFGGANMMQLSAKIPTGDDKEISSALEEAALKANYLAKMLRRCGYDAYEYHDRNSSMVCVGGFDSLGGTDADGVFHYSPEITATIETFGGTKGFETTKYGPLPVPKTLLDVAGAEKFPELREGTAAEKQDKMRKFCVPFDVTPKAIFVPRPATQTIYKQSLLGLR